MTKPIPVQNKSLALRLQDKVISKSLTSQSDLSVFAKSMRMSFCREGGRRLASIGIKRGIHIFKSMVLVVSMCMNSSHLPMFVRNQKSNRPKEENMMSGCQNSPFLR